MDVSAQMARQEITALVVFNTILQAADFALSYLGMATGVLSEANPLLALLFGQVGPLAGLALAKGMAVMLVLALAARGHTHALEALGNLYELVLGSILAQFCV